LLVAVDFVVLVAGTRAHAKAVRDEAAAVLAPMGRCLSPTKTRIAHIDEGCHPVSPARPLASP
jgi:RNA-directed DNA polymerase